MPPHQDKTRTRHADSRRVDCSTVDPSGTVLAMSAESITVTVRDDEDIQPVIDRLTAQGYTELVASHWDVAQQADVLTYARP